MTTPNRPQLWWQAAWSADPNTDPADPLWMRRWTDITPMVRKVSGISRGRMYELVKSQAGQPSINFWDPNEYLNQANTDSPYYPDVQPLRELLGQAMWDNGGTGNLINPDMWMPNDIAPLDPSFEGYSNGAAAPDTVTAVGGVTPTITTTNPQQGTKSLTYTVAAVATRQGVSWEVPCVPGQEYTTSAYIRQSSASTQWLMVDGLNNAWDNYERTEVDTWGDADSGQTWAPTGGAASAYFVSDGQGKISVTAVNSSRIQLIDTGGTDGRAVYYFTVPAVATGASYFTYLFMRGTDASNAYYARIEWATSGNATLRMARFVAAASTLLGSGVSLGPYAAGEVWALAFDLVGTQLQAKAWNTTGNQPRDWQETVTDSTITTGTLAGPRAFLNSGVTNTLPMLFAYDRFAVIGTTASSTTTTTGAYVRLSKTFIATAPTHTVTVATRGTAVAGTVNVDAIQHEPGDTASAFTTSGPCIYPILLDNVERWPRSNVEDTAGFAGQCDTTAVDGLAALNAITLDPDYAAAVMALEPDYLWRLDGGSGTSTAQETSGNQGPPLIPFDSKYGPGNPVEFGTPIEIVGAYGGTGAMFTPVDNSTAFTPDTILSTGRATGTPQIRFPAGGFNTSQWSATITAWVKATPTDPVSSMIVAFPLAVVSPIPTAPIFLQIVGDTAVAQIQSPNGSSLTTGSGVVVADGTPHLLVGTITQVSGGNTTVNLYVDGELDDTQSATTTSLGGMFTAPCTVMGVGGAGINGSQVINGVVAYTALWDRELSADEVTALWTAGGLGHAGELSGTRVARRLEQGGYNGATRISAGSTTMQPSTAGTVDALTDAQNTTTVEDGTMWVAPDGAFVFEGRQERWLRLTARGVFGEDETGGEIPYLDGVRFDYDPAFVFANVRVSRVNGTTAVGGTAVDIATAARRFFPRSSPPDSGDYETDALAQYKADWTFNSHKAPLRRVSVLTIDPSSNPALWKKALGIEIGQRWTVKRRAKAANAGAGITMSEDYFVERVIHNEINMDTGRWTISLIMSPIGLVTNPPGVTFQPWILENATYGILDSTTVLGW